MRLKALVFAVVLLVPGIARAVTMADLIALSKAGVSDSILIALIQADHTEFTLDADQILDLRRAGVSDAVLLEMITSGITSSSKATARTQAPIVVIIGHDPHDVPSAVEPVTVPYYVPVPIFGVTSQHRTHRTAKPAIPVIGLPIRNGEFVCR